MEKMKVKGLSGVIMSSANADRLAGFYKEVLGLPLELNRHGNSPKHWECDYHGIHFAVLKRKFDEQANENIVASFYVEDIEQFVVQHTIKLVGSIMDLGEGAFSAGFKDPDGNSVRLWMHKSK